MPALSTYLPHMKRRKQDHTLIDKILIATMALLSLVSMPQGVLSAPSVAGSDFWFYIVIVGITTIFFLIYAVLSLAVAVRHFRIARAKGAHVRYIVTLIFWLILGQLGVHRMINGDIFGMMLLIMTGIGIGLCITGIGLGLGSIILFVAFAWRLFDIFFLLTIVLEAASSRRVRVEHATAPSQQQQIVQQQVEYSGPIEQYSAQPAETTVVVQGLPGEQSSQFSDQRYAAYMTQQAQPLQPTMYSQYYHKS